MTHPGKCCVKDSVGQFLHTPDIGQDTKKSSFEVPGWAQWTTNSIHNNPVKILHRFCRFSMQRTAESGIFLFILLLFFTGTLP